MFFSFGFSVSKLFALAKTAISALVISVSSGIISVHENHILVKSIIDGWEIIVSSKVIFRHKERSSYYLSRIGVALYTERGEAFYQLLSRNHKAEN